MQDVVTWYKVPVGIGHLFPDQPLFPRKNTVEDTQLSLALVVEAILNRRHFLRVKKVEPAGHKWSMVIAASGQQGKLTIQPGGRTAPEDSFGNATTVGAHISLYTIVGIGQGQVFVVLVDNVCHDGTRLP